jgi:hypothetical protein
MRLPTYRSLLRLLSAALIVGCSSGAADPGATEDSTVPSAEDEEKDAPRSPYAEAEPDGDRATVAPHFEIKNLAEDAVEAAASAEHLYVSRRSSTGSGVRVDVDPDIRGGQLATRNLDLSGRLMASGTRVCIGGGPRSGCWDPQSDEVLTTSGCPNCTGGLGVGTTLVSVFGRKLADHSTQLVFSRYGYGLEGSTQRVIHSLPCCTYSYEYVGRNAQVSDQAIFYMHAGAHGISLNGEALGGTLTEMSRSTRLFIRGKRWIGANPEGFVHGTVFRVGSALHEAVDGRLSAGYEEVIGAGFGDGDILYACVAVQNSDRQSENRILIGATRGSKWTTSIPLPSRPTSCEFHARPGVVFLLADQKLLAITQQ